MARVILVGTLEPYTEEKKPNDQIWCLNRAYRHQPNLDRLYLMDPIEVYNEKWGPEWVHEVRDLPCPIYVRDPEEGIPNGLQFNFLESFDNFGISFFGATAANAIANAIEEKVEEIVLHRMYIKGLSDKYLHHKAVIGFWVGEAVAHGVKVTVDPDCFMKQDIIDRIQKNYGIVCENNVMLPVPDLRKMINDEWEAQQERKRAESPSPQTTRT